MGMGYRIANGVLKQNEELLRSSEKERKAYAESLRKINKQQNNLNEEYEENTLEKDVYYLCTCDEKVKLFFAKLTEASIKIDDMDKKKYLKSFVDVSNKYFEMERKLNNKLAELEKEGLTLSENYRSKEHFSPVKTKISCGFCETDIGYNEYKSYVSGFNGIRITKQTLLDGDKNIYNFEYMFWQKQKEEVLLKEKQLEQLITKKRTKLKFSLFKREEKEEEISDLEKDLVEIRLKIEEGQQAKDKLIIFNNLTSNQRIKLIEYFEYVEECEELGAKIKKIVNQVIGIDNYENSSFNERDKWNRTFNLFLDSEDYDVNLEMDYVNKVILEAMSKKNQGIKTNSLNQISNSMAYSINWYVSKLNCDSQIELKDKSVKIK